MDRNSLVKLIHVAKRDRRLDDDTYRQLLDNYTGLSSTKDMSVKQLEDVMEALYKLGFRTTFKNQGRLRLPMSSRRKSGRCGWRW